MPKEIKIGIFGLGTVGQSVVEQIRVNGLLIEARTGILPRVIKAVTANPHKPRSVDLTDIEVSADPNFILDDPEIDLVIELIGGCDLAKEILLTSFAKGKAVVTANKALLAVHSREIFGAAAKTGARLGFEASVAGGIPILRMIREGLSGDRITGVSGIINGTSNYILTQMSEQGQSFADALKDAQALGYAEADPTFDVEGIDQAHKLLILMNLAFGGLFSFDQLYAEGITQIESIDIAMAKEFGYKIKLLGKAIDRGGSYEGRVHPALVPEDDLLAAVNGAFNAVSVEADFAGHLMAYGRGAGGHPTSSAVVADLVGVIRSFKGEAPPPLSLLPDRLVPKEILPIGEISSEYYLRFSVLDRVGVLAKITRALGDQNISISSMIQNERAAKAKDAVDVVIFTHQALERDIRKALEEIGQMDFIARPTKLIRVDSP
ncbi:MAG: hypothetical protein A2527_05375 [Candidatus Lambdaproteobacteria bacterium RIFOXYD2_FULL_50_16]|uniref:Homoserine dehydrogenase n=1 Tax=Candidatus Lambdaproteobacteria bacterium RIFOXYD2_FULL_50_16 TaxID=1817772 RepID=A0A1F6G920_9PROT|nr:MAG: hypothetical protein A2527_05375 [Candidatus Lambdaproteobacteria bacterium RIFOXYD2_FULL_50_16]